ncbi:unnamed protein product [Tilletia laevis]|uniref:Uncharacterized protein n=1 Tax=Tilletia controversa TaxID=13291 RepID=A0A8X7SVL5_9BASI|nr:hypothetical protein A4X06_0g5712 [Tilletia controversa]CAD6951372.1 unnamed protein product [Tilletia laevis]
MSDNKITSVETMRKAPVEPGIPPNDDADDAVKADWELRNDRAFGVIALSCTKRIRNGLHKITTAKTVLEHLRTEFVSKSLPAILEAERQYENLLKKPTSPIRN